MKTELADNKSNVQSIDRTFNIIETLSAHPRGLHLTDLANELNLHISTVHRLLNCLAVHGYVQKDPGSGKYRLTMRLFEIGSRVVCGTNILSVAKPYLEHLADLTGEAIHLVVRDGDEVVYLYKEESSNSVIRMGSSVGLRNPLYCTGVGKAILAGLSDDEVESIWQRTHFTKFTNKTITDYEQMKRELAAVRRRHFAIDDEEHERGVKCIAAAIMDFSNSPVAALSISAPASRLSDEDIARIAPYILTASHEISTLLGNNTTPGG